MISIKRFLGLLLWMISVNSISFSTLCGKSKIERCNSWRVVQENARDTVVQIFSQSTPIDIIHLYRTPNQNSVTGSAFFINEHGELVTNAHVVDQAASIWIQVPSLGKRLLKVELISICPERDLALLKLSDNAKASIIKSLGKIPFLPLGNSDDVYRSDEVLALGYPLGQQSLKSTKGVISGTEEGLIQMDAATNPGSSGGPLLNSAGEVIGISASKIAGQAVDNVSYVIPINLLRLVLDDMHKIPLLRKPMLGVFMGNATDELTDYLGNPQPGGSYVIEITKDSTFYKAGLKRGDMIYEIDGYRLDIYGEMSPEWCEDKISILNYISRLKIGQKVDLLIYRKGEPITISITVTQEDLPAIRNIYPGYEKIDYEIFAGMVVTPLTMNHINLFMGYAPGVMRYIETTKKNMPVLIITHIFHNSELHRTRTLYPGVILNEVNGIEVKSLDDFRNAINKSLKEKYLVLRATDTISCCSDNVMSVLSTKKILEEEPALAHLYCYPISSIVLKFLEKEAS